MVSRLFTSYFRDGLDIGDKHVLLSIAEAIGLDRAMTERLLMSDADADDIRARDAHARDRGVTGVPTFVLANQHVLVGAQPTDLWEKVIADIAENFSANASG